MKRLIELNINGEICELAVEPNATLAEVLRDQMDLTGTKVACGTGECGTCTVLIDGRPILSCLTLAIDCQKQSILTVEGLSEGETLTPVQQAFHDCGAIQCGNGSIHNRLAGSQSPPVDAGDSKSARGSSVPLYGL